MNEPTTIDIQIYVRISGTASMKSRILHNLIQSLEQCPGIDDIDWDAVVS